MRFELGDIGQDRSPRVRGFTHIADVVAELTKRCACSRIILREHKTGPLHKRCTECRAQHRRLQWREVKKRRAARYGRTGPSRQGTRWRWLAAQG